MMDDNKRSIETSVFEHSYFIYALPVYVGPERHNLKSSHNSFSFFKDLTNRLIFHNFATISVGGLRRYNWINFVDRFIPSVRLHVYVN